MVQLSLRREFLKNNVNFMIQLGLRREFLKKLRKFHGLVGPPAGNFEKNKVNFMVQVALRGDFLKKKKKMSFMVQLGLRRECLKKTTTCKTKKSIFRFSKMALNHVLIAPEYSRRRELSKSYLNIFYLPIFDRFVAHQSSKKNFGPNVIYCFFSLFLAFNIAYLFAIHPRESNHALTFSISQFLIGLRLTENQQIMLVPMSYIAFLGYVDIIW